jgi:hypothetical protein
LNNRAGRANFIARRWLNCAEQLRREAMLIVTPGLSFPIERGPA